MFVDNQRPFGLNVSNGKQYWLLKSSRENGLPRSSLIIEVISIMTHYRDIEETYEFRDKIGLPRLWTLSMQHKPGAE